MPSPLPADPRCFAAYADDPYVASAEDWLRASSAPQRAAPPPALVLRYRNALQQARDAEIRRSLRSATSPEVYRCLASALDTAVHDVDPGVQVTLRPFAIPLLVVTGGRAGVEVPGILPDIGRVHRLLHEYGALGRVQTFELGNALCDASALAAVSPGRLHALTRGTTASGIAALHLTPTSIRTATPDEDIHLRFLAGAVLAPVDAPSLGETGASIGRWGLPLTQELAAQLKMPDLSVLPIPRPPASLIAALAAGWIAREELAVQAFVSRALRRLRGEVGEPAATIAAVNAESSSTGPSDCGVSHVGPVHADYEPGMPGFDLKCLALRFVSPFDGQRVEIHRRSLHPSEDLSTVVADLLALLEECRVRLITILPGLQRASDFAAPGAAATAGS